MLEKNKNTTVALDNIFDECFSMIAAAKHVPFTDKLIIEEDELTRIIEDLQAAIPKEIKTASQVLEEQKNIVNNAYAEAERIVAQAKSESERIVALAKAEADRVVQEEEIVKQANAVAEEIKANAMHYSEEVKQEADEYAYGVKQSALQYSGDMLAYLGDGLQSALQGIRDNSATIEKEMHNLNTAPAPAQSYEEAAPEEMPVEEE